MGMKLNEVREWIKDRNDCWYRDLHRWCKSTHGIEVPEPKLVLIEDRVTNAAGKYFKTRHEVQLSLPYAMLHRDDYDTTIAHEMVHAFQWAILPKCKGHGELFYYIFWHVTGHHGKPHTHSYSVSKAKELAKVLRVAIRMEKLKDGISEDVEPKAASPKVRSPKARRPLRRSSSRSKRSN